MNRIKHDTKIQVGIVQHKAIFPWNSLSSHYTENIRREKNPTHDVALITRESDLALGRSLATANFTTMSSWKRNSSNAWARSSNQRLETAWRKLKLNSWMGDHSLPDAVTRVSLLNLVLLPKSTCTSKIVQKGLKRACCIGGMQPGIES